MMAKREIKDISLRIKSQDLGLEVSGGRINAQGIELDFGIFVKSLLRNGVASACKIINVGDEIIEINGRSISGTSKRRVKNLLQKAASSGQVDLALSSDSFAKMKWERFLDWNLSKAEEVLKVSVKQDGCKSTQGNERNLESKNIKKYLKSMRVIKTTAGLGLKLQFYTEKVCLSKSSSAGISFDCFRISFIALGSDVAENGHLHIGDVITEINNVVLFGKSAREVQAVLLREKLTCNYSVEISYMDADTPLPIIHNVLETCYVTPGDASSVEERDYQIEQVLDDNDAKNQNLSSNNGRKFLTDDALVKIKTLQFVMEQFGLTQSQTYDELTHCENKQFICYGDFVKKLLAVLSKNHEYSQKTLCTDLMDYNEEIFLLQRKVSKLKLENKNLHKEVGQLTLKLSEVARNNSSESLEKLKNYEEKIRLLEEEITHLHSSETSLVKLDDENEKELSLLECECRKLKEIREEQEQTIEQLVLFLDKVSQSVFSRVESNETEANLHKLCYEAQHLACVKRQEMQVQDLPYGWEKASLSDGNTFFIDHLNHTTSWVDPRHVSNDDRASVDTSQIHVSG